MKSLLAFSLMISALLISAMPAVAQVGIPHNGPLGGNAALGAMSRPLGGFAPGFNGFNVSRGVMNPRGSRRGLIGYPYAYSVWVPDSFDYMNTQSQYGAPYGYSAPYGTAAAPAPYYDPGNAAASQQPVIINQYFGGPAPAQTTPQAQAPAAPEANNATSAAPGDPIGNPQTYYLIAYKNHAIYAALAYWLEDKTLHYVTTQNTHNQASLELIDLALTKSLNQDRQVPFSIAAQ